MFLYFLIYIYKYKIINFLWYKPMYNNKKLKAIILLLLLIYM